MTGTLHLHYVRLHAKLSRQVPLCHSCFYLCLSNCIAVHISCFHKFHHTQPPLRFNTYLSLSLFHTPYYYYLKRSIPSSPGPILSVTLLLSVSEMTINLLLETSLFLFHLSSLPRGISSTSVL